VRPKAGTDGVAPIDGLLLTAPPELLLRYGTSLDRNLLHHDPRIAGRYRYRSRNH